MSRALETAKSQQSNSGPIPPFAAGKNKVINGAFDNWQRGTTFTPTNSTYTADRFAMTSDGTGATRTITQQTFTPGTAPVAGYEGRFFLRYVQTVAGSSGTGNYLFHRIEDVRTFAGQTVTLSFWAKADATRVVTLTLGQLFGTGGSPSSQVDTSLGTVSLTTSWVRYTATVAVPSISGKTIGTANDSNLQVLLTYPTNATMTIDLWGVQLEAGSSATPFQTATGNPASELAACQRYYQVLGALYGYALSGDAIQGLVASSPMRVNPSFTLTTSTPYAESPINVTARNGVNSTTVGSPDVNKYGSQLVRVTGFSGMTAGQSASIAGGQIVLSAEL
jgi:hypothetical protein